MRRCSWINSPRVGDGCQGVVYSTNRRRGEDSKRVCIEGLTTVGDSPGRDPDKCVRVWALGVSVSLSVSQPVSPGRQRKAARAVPRHSTLLLDSKSGVRGRAGRRRSSAEISRARSPRPQMPRTHRRWAASLSCRHASVQRAAWTLPAAGPHLMFKEGSSNQCPRHRGSNRAGWSEWSGKSNQLASFEDGNILRKVAFFHSQHGRISKRLLIFFTKRLSKRTSAEWVMTPV